MKSRRRARESVLQALYQCDTLGDWSMEAYKLYCSSFSGSPCNPADGGSAGKPAADFASELFSGITSHLEAIDCRISAASLHWSLERMSKVDRNILRIGCYELVYLKDVPAGVAIDEAIEIAKKYSADDSRTFINGVLDNVARTSRAEEL